MAYFWRHLTGGNDGSRKPVDGKKTGFLTELLWDGRGL